MSFGSTTELAVIRDQPDRFTWGKVKLIHDIGRYTIVEYYGRAYVNGRPITAYEEIPAFHVYVGGEDMSVGAKTLEGALIHAIALGQMQSDAARWMAIAALKLLDVHE